MHRYRILSKRTVYKCVLAADEILVTDLRNRAIQSECSLYQVPLEPYLTHSVERYRHLVSISFREEVLLASLR